MSIRASERRSPCLRRKPSRHGRARPAPVGVLLWAAIGVLWLVAGAPVGAQVTLTSDDDPPAPGSLRAEIESSTPGEVIPIQIDVGEEVGFIDLRTGLVFDNDLTLDNAGVEFSLIEIDAPEAGAFLTIEDGVTLTLRDIGLLNNQRNGGDDIEIVGATSSLVIDVERADQSIFVDLVGNGSLVKEGAASLELFGTNSFTGSLTIRNGDVVGDLQSLTAPTIDLAPNVATQTARVVFDLSGTSVLGATGPMITDSSTNGASAILAKRGDGTLDITNAMIDPTIGIRVEAGTILAGSANFLAGHAFEIDSLATLDLSFATAALSSTSRLAGAGTFSTNATALTLTGDLSGFSGLLDLGASSGAGTRVVVDPALPSPALGFDIVIEDNTSSFVFRDDDGLLYTGNVSGTGRFVKEGVGITELTGVFSQTGGTEVLAGTLRGSPSNLQGTISVASGARLSFSHSADASFGGTIVASGGSIAVEKIGSGVLTLATTQSFTGSLAVDGGGLFFASGAGLPNAGLSIGRGGAGGRVSLGAAFDPAGAASNTIAIGGPLSIEANGLVRVGIADTANLNTRYAATGPVTIAPGAQLVVDSAPGNYTAGLTYDVLTGASVSGDFTIEQSLFFFDFLGAVVGNAYRISLADSGNTFSAVAATPNEQVIGAQLDFFRTAPTGGDPLIEAYQTALNSIRASEVGPILDEVSPDELAAPTQIQLANAGRLWRGLSDRMALHRKRWIGHRDVLQTRRLTERRNAAERARRRRGGSAGPSSAVRQEPPAAPSLGERRVGPWVAWLDGGGLLGELQSSDANGVDYLSAGSTVGADRALSEAVRLGFALGGSYNRFEATEGEAEGDGGAVDATVYGAWLGEPFDLLIGGRYAHAWIDTNRRFQASLQTGRADGEMEGDVFGVYAELTRAFDGPGGLVIAPLASVAYTHVRWEAFDESGGSPLSVDVDDQEVDSALTSLGLRLSTEREMDDGILIRPRVTVLWNHEWADVERDVSARFSSSPTTGNTPFKVEGAEVPRDHAAISAGWEVGYVSNANLFVDWQGRFGEDLVENAVSLGLRVAW